ncbi:MAG: tetratricopeptide repeat protein [Candidatus Omnitrophica bacterium]|nr:tetratricopeptide repeat protein [Candidatus Omnitrophota bacterium]
MVDKGDEMLILRFKIIVLAVLVVLFLSGSFNFAFALDKEDEAFYVGKKAFSDGFYQASATLFEKFVKNFPQSDNLNKAKLYIAKSLYFQKKYAQALEILKDILSEETDRDIKSEIYYWLAEIYFEGKNYRQSLDYAKIVVEKFENSSIYWWNYYLIGECYFSLEQYDNSKEAFKEIVTKSTKKDVVEKSIFRLLTIHYFQENYSELIDLADKFSSYFSKDTLKAEVILYKGAGFYGKGDFDQARKIFNKGLKLASDIKLKDIFHQRIGCCWLDEGEIEKAKIQFEKIESEELKQFSYINYYFKQKNYSPALTFVNKFLDGFPQSEYKLRVYLTRADCLYEMGRVKDSLYLYQKILAESNLLRSRSIIDKARYGLAWCYLKLGEFKKAIDEFKKTLKYTENLIVRISSQIQIADAYQEKGMYKMALDIYNNVLEEYPENVYSDYIQFQIGMLFLKNNKLEEAKLSFKNLEKNFPSSKLIPQAKYYLAASYFSEEDYARAKNILQKFLRDFPDDFLMNKAHYLYAKCFFNQGRYQEALEIFISITNESKDRKIQELVNIDKAYAYLNLSEFDKAKEMFKEFIRNFPYSDYIPSVLLNLGALCEKNGEFKDALRHYQRIIDAYQDTTSYYEANMALACLYWENKDLVKAKFYLNRLKKIENKKIAYKAELYLGEILAQEGKVEEALDLYGKLIRLNQPISGMASAKKAFLYKELKDYQNAVVFFKQAVEKGIENPQVHFSLGYCLEKSAREPEAISEYFRIVHLFNDSKYKVKAYFRIAKIYEKQNKLDEAKKVYNKLIELDVAEANIARIRIEEIDRISGGNQ